MLRPSKPLVGGLLFIYFLFLVLSRAPADLVVAIAGKASPQTQLNGVSGTLWTGRAANAVLDLNGTQLDVGALSWTVNPWSFLTLKACVDLKSDKVSGNACRSITSSNSLSDFQIDLPASLANSIVKEAKVDGFASVSLEQAKFDDALSIKALKGQLSWRQASVSASGMSFTLGDYAADLSANGQGGAIAEIFDLSGPIKVNLKADLTVGQEPRINGQVIPGPEAPPQIGDVLSFVATPRDGGGYNIAIPMGG